VIDSDHVLLVDHRDAGLWLPSGGHVEPGEHPRATVARELREELGFAAEHAIDAPLMVTCSTTVGLSAGHTDVSLWYVVRRCRDRALDVDEGESRSVRWFPFADVPLDRSDPNLGRFLAKLQREHRPDRRGVDWRSTPRQGRGLSDEPRMERKTKPKNEAVAGAATPRKPTVKKKAPPTAAAAEPSASRLIDLRIRELEGWRGETLARMRMLILEADPDVTEEWKWSNPVWSHHGILCTGEAYKKAVKLTFARGASVPDPAKLFTSSLEGNVRRALDIAEGVTVDAAAFKALVKAAVAVNAATRKK
jgi:8-oxo-dGTP pyrophosphatase MutT (NUDIX family)